VFSNISYVRNNHIDTGRLRPMFPSIDCIEVLKVYDQCMTGVTLQGFELAATECTSTIPDDAVVTCSVAPNTAACFIVSSGAYTTPFFRQVNSMSSVQVQVTISSQQGFISCGPLTIVLQGLASPVLWMPEGALAQCAILNMDNCSCAVVTNPDSGTQIIACSVQVCEEILVTAPVKLLVPSYGFCKLPACPSTSFMQP
jgi:hypothetical protein